MAHFAQLNENNIVTQVVVVSNNDCMLDGVENETVGVLFCKSLFGQDTVWKQTSYNGKIRKNYAGIGFTYNPELDAFIPPKPFDSWLLDEVTCTWVSPVPKPDTENVYFWDEATISWILATENKDTV